MKKVLTKKDFKLLSEWLKEGNNGKAEIYWDYNDQLSFEQVKEIVDGNFIDVENSITDDNTDYIFELERTVIINALKHFDLYDKYDVIDIREELIDFIEVSSNMEQLIRNTGNLHVRITLYSNYDCINSHWFEQSSGGYQYGETYFGAMVDALNLNPKQVREMFVENHDKMPGKWPSIKNRIGNEFIDYKQFFVEMENQSCGACNLTIVGLMSVSDFMDGKPKEIIIPKGNSVGMFSSMNGGGSCIEAPLLKDMEIDLSKAHPTEYDRWALELDYGSYSIDGAYGVTKEFWKNKIIVKSHQKQTT